MLLCLDVGNSLILGGVLDSEAITLRFRTNNYQRASSDELGLFLRQVLSENNINPKNIHAISISSVVPDINYSIRAACIKYFDITPFFLDVNNLQKLKNLYQPPNQIGTDRVANALAAIDRYPETNLIIVDFGTATTICAINRKHEYLGGAILPGLRLSMDALQSHTAQLKAVEIINPNTSLGRNTTKGIQSGMFYGQYGAIKHIANDIIHKEFDNTECVIIGTGGFSHMFSDFDFFDAILPDLVLDGLRIGCHLHNN